MSARYSVEGPWQEADRSDVTFYNDDRDRITHVLTEYATLRDNRGGWTYPNGAYRVRITGYRPSDCPRGKTFRGESAWSQADCYARDAVWALRRRTGGD